MAIAIEKFQVLRPGDPAPAFTARTLDGKEVRLEDLRGKVVLLDFWATWCAPCVAEIPHIRRVLERFGGSGELVVVGISLDADPEKVKRFAEEKGMTWPITVGGPAQENEIAKLYNVTSIPATFLLDREGKIAACDLRGPKLAEEVGKLLPEGAPPAQIKE